MRGGLIGSNSRLREGFKRKEIWNLSGPILVCVVSIVGGCLRGFIGVLLADFGKEIKGKNSGNFRDPNLVGVCKVCGC